MSVPTHQVDPRPRFSQLSRRSRRMIGLVSVVAVLAVAGVIGSHDTGIAPATTTGDAAASDPGVASADLAPDTTMAAPGAPAGGDAVAKVSATAPGEEAAAGSGGSTATATDGDLADLGGSKIDAKIVRTGSMEVEVARGGFDRAYARLTTLANGSGGFVSASQTTALDDTPQGTITLRVPVARFDQVLTQVRKLGKVSAITTGSDDVSGEYSDVSARIHALRAERDQINLVLSRAETIPDILSVRDRLTAVQGELEQLQGRKQVLDDQTSLSTLTVTLREKGTASSVTIHSPAERTGFALLWHDSVDRFAQGGRSIALGLAAMLPWLLLALVLFVPARAIWRRGATGTGPSHPAAAGSDG